MTCKTLGVFNRSWNEKKSMDMGSVEMSQYRRQFLEKGIKFEVYPKERDIHVFQAPFVVQEHWEKKNPRDKLQLVNLENSSTLEYVNC